MLPTSASTPSISAPGAMATSRTASTYTMQYILNVQRTLGRSTTLEVGYIGSQSRHVDNLTNENAPIPGITAFATRAPYPEFAGIQYLRAEGVANYNGLGARLSQRF